MSATVVFGRTTASSTCTTPLSADKSKPETGAWLTKTSVPSIVTFNVLSVFNGCTISPLLNDADNASAPRTWYCKISDRFDKAKRPGISVSKATAKASKASLVGANTVNSGLVRSTPSIPACKIAASR